MASHKISVVIPLYNGEKYLLQCLKSISCQDYSNIEILCVDDCSTDNSLELANEYKKKDDRVVVFQMERNSGSGPARNFGMARATGDYIAFCDSDDIYQPKSLSALHHAMTECGARVSAGNISIMDENLQCRLPLSEIALGLHFDVSGCHEPETYPPLWIPYFHPRFLFERRFLQDNALAYPDLRLGQDPPFLAAVLCKAKNVAVTAETVYYYRRHENKPNRSSEKVVKDYMEHIRKTVQVFLDCGRVKQAYLYLAYMAKDTNFRKLKKLDPGVRKHVFDTFITLFDSMDTEKIFTADFAPYVVDMKRVKLVETRMRHGYWRYFVKKHLPGY